MSCFLLGGLGGYVLEFLCFLGFDHFEFGKILEWSIEYIYIDRCKMMQGTGLSGEDLLEQI